MAERMAVPEDGSFDHFAPENVSSVVTWLCSEASSHVTGQIIEAEGGVLLLLTVGAAQQALIKALVGNSQMSVLRLRKPCRPQCLRNRSGVVRSRFEVCVYR